tara:strand:- start:1035 stop:1358 length:324 start_codon:yes stop_codon:yes gene_type:complete
MKYFSEKEKKLEIALDKLKKLNLADEEVKKNIKFLSHQKNQLEIEKAELENNHKTLIHEHQKLKDQLKTIKETNSQNKVDQYKFDEKIDELNQETDILLNEINKWQT